VDLGRKGEKPIEGKTATLSTHTFPTAKGEKEVKRETLLEL